MRPRIGEPGATFADRVLVRCPRCAACALIAAPAGTARLTCGACGLARELAPRESGASLLGSASRAFRTYDGEHRPSGAQLWLEAECCGGHRLWALNADHLDYLAAFIGSSARAREFPSPAGARQLADRLPAWMTQREHRDEVLRVLTRLRSTL